MIGRRRRRRARDWRSRYLVDGEQVRLECRQHPAAILGALGEALLLAVPLTLVSWGLGGIVLLRGAPYRAVLLTVTAVLAVVALRLAWRVLNWELERVVVTDQKVIHVHGVLARRIAATPLAKVSELTVRQPLLGRVLGYGSLVVDVPGGRDQALHGCDFLPDPASMYRLVCTPVGGAPTVPAPSDDTGHTTVLRRAIG